MLRYIRELGYIANPNPLKETELIISADKADGPTFTFKRGGGEIMDLELRYEQKRDEKSPRRHADAHLPPRGKAYHVRKGVDCGNGKHRAIVQPRIAKKARRADREPFTHMHVKGMARRLEKEGDEMTIHLRLQPEMINQDVIVLEGFGGEIDGPWETAAVVHRIGEGVARTEAACWRK